VQYWLQKSQVRHFALRAMLKCVPQIFESKYVGVTVTTFVAKAAFPFLSKIAFIEMECFSKTFARGIKLYNSKHVALEQQRPQDFKGAHFRITVSSL
jgi:hypothetical protein